MVNAGDVAFFTGGACILSLLAAKMLGRRKIAAWVDIVARMVFGVVALVVCVTSSGAFRYWDHVTLKDSGPAPNWQGYLAFGLFGLVALATGIRAIPRVFARRLQQC